MKSNSYELVSGSVFGIIAALQAIRAVLQVPGYRSVLKRCRSGSLGLRSLPSAAFAYGRSARHARRGRERSHCPFTGLHSDGGVQ